MKINDMDWWFVTSNIGYTSVTWCAEVPGGVIIRYDVIEGADSEAIDELVEKETKTKEDEKALIKAWGRVTHSSMVFVPNFLN